MNILFLLELMDRIKSMAFETGMQRKWRGGVEGLSEAREENKQSQASLILHSGFR